MIERFLTLASKIARDKDPSATPQNFSIQLDQTLFLPQEKKYKIGLQKAIITYSWYNISPSFLNHIVRYSPDAGVTWKQITIPSGIYSYSDLNSYFHSIMKENGDYTVVSGVDTFDINLSFNINTFKVTILLTNNYQFDTYTQQFGDLIGYNNAILTAATNTGVRLPNITRDREFVYIHCSLVSNSIVNGKYSDVVYVFSTGPLSRSFTYEIADTNIIYSDLNSSAINDIRIRITDQSNAEIDFNGVDLTVMIHIKEDI